MKKTIIILLLIFAVQCSSDKEQVEEPKTEVQLLESERDSAINKIDSIKSELKELEKTRDSLKALTADTLESN